ncbi:DUF4391 domain-containing protein [Actinomyces sp. B33]|uniref:DUF4391 domain-containing protein n=1 Tax=Actinomyces sp. B33 TaxID=2942131 RepID=UPI00234238BB|nr:DUF4391 domain-containing protein [Actinomyces sp. B33]MDC4233164.1 DUF4391 domain-containing protein [Actinomyces sp. B33]
MTADSVLFAWPGESLGRRIPKERVYTESVQARRLREKLVGEVESLTWSRRLSEDSVNLPGTTKVCEIEVLEVVLKGEEVSDGVLEAIDRAIPHPVVFELRRILGGLEESRQLVVLYGAAGAKAKQRPILGTSWVPTASPRTGLPVALDLEALYVRIAAVLGGQEARAGETIAQYGSRIERIRRLRAEIDRADRRIRAEKQFNRRVELNERRKALAAELDALTNGRIGAH